MDVRKLQQRLNTLGYEPKLVVDGDYGPKTKAAVIWFQRNNGLLADGIVGPKTLAKLYPTAVASSITNVSKLRPIPNPNTLDKRISIAAMQMALSQFGVKEYSGKNDGEAVEAFLKSTSLGKGHAWCMAFIYWCYAEAAKALKVPNPLVKTAGVLDQWNRTAKSNKIWISKKDPLQVGDIFIMDYGKGLGHTGIVTKVLADGSVETIEGNTSTLGSREGNQVGKLKRTSLKYAIRF